MPGEYSLSDVLERIYHNQVALEAALMELTLQVEQQGLAEVEKMSGERCKRLVKTLAISSRVWPGSEV